jgi:magnesium transporter
MNPDTLSPADILNRRFFQEYPLDAARRLETLPVSDVVAAVSKHTATIIAPVWRWLLPETSARLILRLPEQLAHELVAELPPQQVVRILGHLRDENRTQILSGLDPTIQSDLDLLLSFPEQTAGRIMNTGISAFRRRTKVGEALDQLRQNGMKTARSLFLVDDEHRLVGRVTLQDAALADPSTPLADLEQPLPSVLRAIDSLEHVTEIFMRGDVLDVPVIDHDGVFIGAVTHDDLSDTVRSDATIDMQTMVGANKSEKALSSPFFATRTRMPWLQVNLVTAFMAAAVVGVFEATIAQVTALAVLLPVVAGQSGNTGAQALAVTMRGLALREITVRQWFKVLRKEVIAGFLNGIAIAITCGIGVFIWSGSPGLVAVIMSSMVLAMVAAGFAGAVIPVILTRLGQDPATSSSIILTTVTDIAGFFAFLGIATLLMQYL